VWLWDPSACVHAGVHAHDCHAGMNMACCGCWGAMRVARLLLLHGTCVSPRLACSETSTVHYAVCLMAHCAVRVMLQASFNLRFRVVTPPPGATLSPQHRHTGLLILCCDAACCDPLCVCTHACVCGVRCLSAAASC
jgi:hypothetical protein